MSRATSVLNALQAEQLLQGSFVLNQIDSLRNSLQYNTEGQTISFDDYYLRLQTQVDELPKLKLETAVATGTENQYIMQLIKAMEEIVDQADTLVRKIIHYQSKLKNAASQIKKLSAAFNAWYTLAASELLEENSVKFPANQLKDLANSEFSRLMKNTDVEVDSLIAAVVVQTEQIKQWKKTQQEKFGLGRDQANASWTSSLPNFGEAPERSDQLLDKPKFVQEEDDAEVPQFVSKVPKVSPALVERVMEKIQPAPEIVAASKREAEPIISEGGNLSSLAYQAMAREEKATKVAVIGTAGPEVEGAIKAVFKKTGPPVAVTPIVTDSGKPAIIEIPGPPTVDIDQVAPVLPAALTSVFANAVEVKDTPAAPKVAKPKKAAIEYRVPVDGETIVLRDSDPAEKIKCVVCDRRIRSKQEMFARDGGWAHANEGECTGAPAVSRTPSQEWLKKAAKAEDGCGPIMACSPEILAAAGGDPNNTVAIMDAAFGKMTAVAAASASTVLADLEAKAATPIAAVSPVITPDKGTADAVPDAPATPRKRLTFLEDDAEIM